MALVIFLNIVVSFTLIILSVYVECSVLCILGFIELLTAILLAYFNQEEYTNTKDNTQ